RIIAASRHARPRKRSAGVRIGPGSAAVRGPENFIGVIVREAATAFIHARDVHVACDRFAGNLHVADEAASNPVLSPGVTVVSGNTNLESASTDIEVVPGDVHVSEVRRRGVVVSPAGLSVVTTVGMHTEMGPASRDQRSAGFVSAQCTGSIGVDPNGKPSDRWLVVQNNVVAKAVG